ncbi:prion-inhibition and propagation-domain-containing protein [Mycena sp. CBHHK59/15]|nr:prion-inhibition and propagation-domain-containing protein [Mycena sp. CBHHK59/15]
MAVALPIIGLLGQCYSGAIQAYLFIQDAVDFPDTAAKLVIQLEVERIRLQLWGRNSGADSDALHPGLAPFEPLILDILTKVKELLGDSDKLKADYGLVSSMDGSVQLDKNRPVDQIKDVFRCALAFTAPERRKKAKGTSDSTTPPSLPAVSQDALARKTYERIRWVVVSKSRFEALIADLRRLTNNLNELLRESQLVHLSQQWHSIELQAVAHTDDQQVLSALREAVEGDENSRDISSMARRKSIIISPRDLDVPKSGTKVLSKDDFELPTDFATISRCIAVYRPLLLPDQQSYVLIERKHYDGDISPENKATLLFRLHNLIELVNSPPSEYLFCLGYWSEPQANCWCLVFKFPLQGITPEPSKDLSTPLSSQPLSLLLFLSSDAFRPPLEARLTLACTLAGVFSRFYGSKWLHKGVRSENIVFPGSTYDIAHPLVAGFEYSRQATAPVSIDRGRTTGPAAYGYRMAYDIYSFGLVLAEIAWWVPLESFLRAAAAAAADKETGFGAEEASELKRMVIARLRKELAFRVGTTYKEVVEWCLTTGDAPSTLSDADLAVAFYTKVVVPLQNISAGQIL